MIKRQKTKTQSDHKETNDHKETHEEAIQNDERQQTSKKYSNVTTNRIKIDVQ